MSPHDFTDLIAHVAASEFLRLQIERPDKEASGMTILAAAGVRIVVSLTKYEGPAQLYPTPEAAKFLGVPVVPPPLVALKVDKLRGLQKDVYEAAPSKLHHPVSMKQLAKLSGYAYSSYFRAQVSALVDAGLLVKVTGGVRKAS